MSLKIILLKLLLHPSGTNVLMSAFPSLGTQYSTQWPCPLGTFGNATAYERSDQCSPCLGGQYCGVLGRTSPTGPCSPGYYCRRYANSSTPNIGYDADVCPQGKGWWQSFWYGYCRFDRATKPFLCFLNGLGRGPSFNIWMLSYKFGKSHCRNKTLLWSSYLHDGNCYTGKTTSLY